jgi:4-hydroxythreonine-4-phosphate dehydrogenase
MSATILITPGDAAGIGPEVALKAAAQRAAHYPLRLLGPAWLWQHAAQTLGLPLAAPVCTPAALAAFAPCGIEYGVVSAALGRVALECVRVGAQMCLAGEAAALVTAPLSKAGLHAAGYTVAGQTDFLAEVTTTARHAMMLSADALRVLLVTHHQSLRSVPDALTSAAILEKIELADEVGRRLRLPQVRIAVAGLNPHAGEGGLFGDEEARVIAPAIAAARARGVTASGPYAPDTIFGRAARGAFEFVIAMYHDQGLIAVKLHGVQRCVNTTVGLPIVRTSPGHGTAYDIAGRGVADAGAMIAAIDMAAQLLTCSDTT